MCKISVTVRLLIVFDYSFRVTSVSTFVADFNLLGCELHKVTFALLYRVMWRWYYIKTKINLLDWFIFER